MRSPVDVGVTPRCERAGLPERSESVVHTGSQSPSGPLTRRVGHWRSRPFKAFLGLPAHWGPKAYSDRNHRMRTVLGCERPFLRAAALSVQSRALRGSCERVPQPCQCSVPAYPARTGTRAWPAASVNLTDTQMLFKYVEIFFHISTSFIWENTSRLYCLFLNR
jgi:hypothetical protein